MSPSKPELLIQRLGRIDYEACAQLMQRAASELAEAREKKRLVPDLLFLCEHPSVYTQGLAGKPAHILEALPYPLVQTNRGGQVTFHGPGQLVAYPVFDLIRLNWGVRRLVSSIETAIIGTLGEFLPSTLLATADPKAPGVYVEDAQNGTRLGKIASLGFKVSRGVSYHGLSINIETDLSAFSRINPCGFSGLTMLNLADLTEETPDLSTIYTTLSKHIRLAHSV